MTGLQALTCLAILLSVDGGDGRIIDEHACPADAIASGDTDGAVEEMLRHLDHVESEMKLERAVAKPSVAKAMRWLRESAG